MLPLILTIVFGLFCQEPYFEYEDVDKRFSILMWNLPEEQIVTIPTDLGKLDFHTFETDIPLDSVIVAIGAVSYCDYPEGSIHSDSISLHEEFFTATVEQSVVRLKGLLIYQDDYFQGRYPGRIWRIHYKDGTAVMKSRAFLIQNRLYIIQTACGKRYSLHPSLDLFLNSFRSQE
jgi:hypothetical protein